MEKFGGIRAIESLKRPKQKPGLNRFSPTRLSEMTQSIPAEDQVHHTKVSVEKVTQKTKN